MASQSPTSQPPCVLFEDEHLLVVNKPAGWNTHAPSPYAGEGIYDWLKHRDPRWASLAIVHRLDKETSGVMVFGKTPLANRSLTDQFAARAVRKTYVLLTDRLVPEETLRVVTHLTRVGDRYRSTSSGDRAETIFKPAALQLVDIDQSQVRIFSAEARPVTGRTHQIRVHAAEKGFPILGDQLYGGRPFARVCLHAAEIQFRHPATQLPLTFAAPAEFTVDARRARRGAVIEPDATDACRLIHGASDGWPGGYAEQLGGFVLYQSDGAVSPGRMAELTLAASARGIYHKTLSRHVRGTAIRERSPQLLAGAAAPVRFTVRENGVQFELSFNEGYSVGLFLDQRDNRRRLLTRHVAAEFSFRVPGSAFQVLNTFAYTCGFSVCAALGGARTTSLDLSKKYLEWGKRNFALNGLDPAQHDFIYGDTFDWLKRLAKKQRQFDVIVLDPPTFSQSKESGVFRAERDYGRLVSAALPVLKPEGVLLASTNAAEWQPEEFLADVALAIHKAGRRIVQQHYVPQPPDFPVSREEPAYLKTVWLRVA